MAPAKKAVGKASVSFCDPDGDAPKRKQLRRKRSPESAKSPILSLPYKLSRRSAQFRRRYPGSAGRSIQAKRPGLSLLGINPGIVSDAVKKLGFARVDEEQAEAAEGLVASADEERLNLLCLASAKCGLQLGGPSYLIIRPYVDRMYLMCTKWFLVQSLRRIEARMRQRKLSFRTGSGRVFTHEQFTPFTLNLNNKNLEEILAKKPGAYLAKPARGSMGQGQQLVRIRADRVQQDLLSFLLSSQFLGMHRSQVILQRYIERPLLVDKRKFDLRVYMLVVNARRGAGGDGLRTEAATAQPGGGGGYFVFMHPGFLRLCTAPYDPEQADLAVHLTNQSVQARLAAETFDQLKEVTTWYPDELNHYLNKRRRLPTQDWTKDVLYPKVGSVLGYVSAMFRPFLDDRDCPTNAFRILGVDFLVDEQLRLYLLEFNSHPSWGRQTSVLNRLKPSLWREAACLTAEVAVRYRAGREVRDDRLATRQNFRLVYSSEEPGMARQNVARMFD